MAKHTTQKTVEDMAMHHVPRKKGRIHLSNQPTLSATFGKSRPYVCCLHPQNNPWKEQLSSAQGL